MDGRWGGRGSRSTVPLWQEHYGTTNLGRAASVLRRGGHLHQPDQRLRLWNGIPVLSHGVHKEPAVRRNHAQLRDHGILREAKRLTHGMTMHRAMG